MKAVRFVIPKTSGNSFRVQVDCQPFFYDTIHYHPEHQLTLIVQGEGTSFIGNKVERYAPGDVFIVGKNVPHVFKSDQVYYRGGDMTSHGISVFLKDETFGREFFEIPEMGHIKRLLELALMGIKVSGHDRQASAKMIKRINTLEGFERFQLLLSLLNLLATSEHLYPLSSVKYHSPSSETDNERINEVFNHISNHFREEITLDEIAAVANMTVNSFCRYFKQRTRKTYSSFLNDIRIEYACKLIASGNDAFNTIALESGYNNVSYFNRKFKQIMGVTPLEYRRRYRMVGQ